MRALFLYEDVSGGGFAEARPPEDLLRQGWAMRDALLADLLRCGRRRILTTLDARLVSVPRPEVELIRVRPGEHERVFRECAERADEAWIIAPETGGRLASLTEAAEAAGARVLGSPADAVRAVADKLALARRLGVAGVRTPRTWPASEADGAGYPRVVKPVHGAGCDGVWLARHAGELPAAVRAAEAAGGVALVQNYIEGRAASVSVLCLDGRALPLSLNAQEVRAGRPFAYLGGCVPLEHRQASEALAAARAACESAAGLRGYVGVDLVLARDGAYVIEINPRVTASYVALREASDVNVAGLVLDAIESGRLPQPPGLRRTVRFSATGELLETKRYRFVNRIGIVAP